MGYGKRITFKPDSLNSPANYFWSDSHPEGLGMETRAIHPGMKFTITGNGVCISLIIKQYKYNSPRFGDLKLKATSLICENVKNNKRRQHLLAASHNRHEFLIKYTKL